MYKFVAIFQLQHTIIQFMQKQTNKFAKKHEIMRSNLVIILNFWILS